MTPVKRPAKRPVRKAPAASVSASTSFGELSGRLRDLFAKTVKPGPYPVTDKILIRPPTRGAWEKLDELQNTVTAARFMQSELLSRISRGADNGPTTADLEEVAKVANDANADYDRLFFGDQLDAVNAITAEWEPADFQAFIGDVKNYFLGRGPDTGTCPHCGNVVDEEQAGKDSASST